MRDAIHPEAQIIWGLALDDSYGDEVKVTVIAAGFDSASKKQDAQEKITLAPAVASAQPSPISVTPAQPQAPVVTEQTTPAFAPSTGDAASRSFDETTEHDVISSNDPSDLDIPDFLR